MDRVDCVVVGAGVIGLAIARQLAKSGLETILLEREKAFGTIASARNSEVIHAGIYYPKDSQKARFCVTGNRLLYAYLESHHIPYQPCGKFIVASETNQLQDLEAIWTRAMNNGVPQMARLGKSEVKALEPALRCVEAIHSKSTGVIDSHAYMLSLLGGFEDAGGMLAYQAPLLRVRPVQDGANGYILDIGGDSNLQIQTQYLINSAGLSAPKVASCIEGLPPSHIPKAYFTKGNYFALQGKSPFNRLIYPIPEPGGLGVHLTLDLGGQAKFGPDVEWLEITDESEINYTVDPLRGELFYAAIRSYWPGLPDASLSPDYSGVRAKITSKLEPAGDFRIDTRDQHGLEGLINLFGFESPGLTSSLAIAEDVRRCLHVA